MSNAQVSLNSKPERDVFCTYSPTKLLQTQSFNDPNIGNNTRHLCALKIIDGQYITTMSGDGTIVMFDPNVAIGRTEFNNAKLLAFYQSSKLYTDKLLNTNMLDILPSTSKSGRSLLVAPSHNNTFSVLGLFHILVYQANTINRYVWKRSRALYSKQRLSGYLLGRSPQWGVPIYRIWKSEFKLWFNDLWMRHFE